MADTEIWKDIEGYDGLYQVSNLGRVKRLAGVYYCGHRNEQKQIIEEKIMKQQVRPKGYLAVSLSNGTKRKTYMVHRLVAQAFIPNPDNLPQVNHKSEVPSENFVENLEWCDNKYNCNYGSHRNNLSKALKGKVVSDETKIKISMANSGSNNGMYGKKPAHSFVKGHTPWNKGVSWDEETKKKMSESKKKTSITYKRPIIMDDEIHFDGIIDAVNFFGCKYTAIQRVIRGERKTYKGHTFRYAS